MKFIPTDSLVSQTEGINSGGEFATGESSYQPNAFGLPGKKKKIGANFFKHMVD